MDAIHEITAQQMDWVELDELRRMLKQKSDTITSQSIYLRAFLIQGVAVYLLSKKGLKRMTATPYNHRIKGCCQMALAICNEFGYISETQFEHYKRILG